MAKNSIQNDLDKLVNAALISPEQATDITAFYQAEKRQNKSMLLLPLIGVFCIGAGFISLCAANWQNMGDFPKLLFGFLPLCLLGFFLWKNRESPSETLIQSLTFGVGFATLATYGIVSNVYQTPVSTELLMRLCLLSLVPLVYVFNAYWLGVLLCAWAIYSGGWDMTLLSALCLAIHFPYGYFRYKEERNMKCLTLLLIVSAYRLVVMIYPEPFSVALCTAGMLALYPLWHSDYFHSVARRLFLFIGLFLSVFDEPLCLEPDVVAVFLYLAAMGFVVYQVYQFEDDKKEQLFYGQALGILVALLLSALALNVFIFVTIFMLTTLGIKAYGCCLNQDLKGYHNASICFTGVIMVHLARFSMGFFATGILFIVMGFVFLFISKIVSDSIKKGSEQP